MIPLQSIDRLRAFNTHWEQLERPRGSILCYNTARSFKDYLNLLETDEVSFWHQIYFCSFVEHFACVECLTATNVRVKGRELLAPDCLITGEGIEVWSRYETA